MVLIAVDGIDIDREFMKLAHRKYEHKQKISILNSHLNYVPFKEDTINFIVCSEVVQYVNKPDKITTEFGRVLKHGRKVTITISNSSLRWSLLEAIRTRYRKEILGNNRKTFTR